MRKAFLATILIIFAFYQANADWPIGKKRALINLTYNLYRANEYFDRQGARKIFAKGDMFLSHSTGVSVVYGLGRHVNLIGNVSRIIYQQSIIDNQLLIKSDWGDAQVGFSLFFPSKSLKSYTSIKLLAIQPLYQNIEKPFVGYGEQGYTIGLSHSFSPALKTFMALEGAYTHYLASDGTGPNQWRGDVTLGKVFGNYFYLIGNVGGVFSKSANPDFSGNLNFNKDFGFIKTALTLGKRITRTTTFYLQGFYFPIGYNAGVGYGGTFTAAIKVP